MSGRISEHRSEFGVLFAAGFAEQRPGSAIASLAAALYCWLLRWNCRTQVWPSSPPVLGDMMLTGTGTRTMSLRTRRWLSLHLSMGERDAR
jgi:hypothetical protein